MRRFRENQTVLLDLQPPLELDKGPVRNLSTLEQRALVQQRKDEQLALDGKIEDAKKGLKGEDLHGGAYDGMDVDRPKRRGKRTRMPFGK